MTIMSHNSTLKQLNLKNVEDGDYIYVYRIYKNEFTTEKCLARVTLPNPDDPTHKYADISKSRGYAGRFNKDNELCGYYSLGWYEGCVHSRGGCDSVWFTKADKRKAKKLLRKLYKERIAKTEAKLDRFNDILGLLK